MLHIQNTTLGLCANPYAPQKKCFWGAVIGAGISALGSLAGNSQQHTYTKEQQRLQSKLNREEMEHSMNLQKNQQEWLMNNQYAKNVSGMQNAGLNPATANGTTPSVPSGGSPSTGSVGPAFHGSDVGAAASNGALAGMQVQSLAEDVEAKQIDNRRKKLILKDEENSSKYGYRTEKTYKDPDTGDVIASGDLDKWMDSHPGKTPELVVTKHNRGQEQQRQQEREWAVQDFERESRTASAQLETAIKTGQMKDKDVMNAFMKLPADQRRTLQKLWREYDDNHDLAELQKELAKLQKQDIEASSFGSLVNTLKGDMGFAEKLFATLGFLANRFTQNTNFSFGWSNKK